MRFFFVPDTSLGLDSADLANRNAKLGGIRGQFASPQKWYSFGCDLCTMALHNGRGLENVITQVWACVKFVPEQCIA